MRNDRPVETGQIRMTRGTGSNHYTVLRLLGQEVEIMWINGKLSGVKQIWSSHHLVNDVVVM